MAKELQKYNDGECGTKVCSYKNEEDFQQEKYMLFWPFLSGPVLKCTKNGPEVYKNAGLKVGVFRPTNIYFLIKKYLFSLKINTLLF